jgi:hypothetical protein
VDLAWHLFGILPSLHSIGLWKILYFLDTTQGYEL